MFMGGLLVENSEEQRPRIEQKLCYKLQVKGLRVWRGSTGVKQVAKDKSIKR